MQKHDIYARVEEFAVRIIGFCEKLAKTFAGSIIAKQLLRSATSIGANLQEADGAVSRKDFINKMGISRKEALETRYWLNLLIKSELIKNESNSKYLSSLYKESDEITKILCSIINRTKGNK